MITNVINLNKRFSSLDANLINAQWTNKCKEDWNLINKHNCYDYKKSLFYDIDSGYYEIDDSKIRKRVKTQGKLYCFLLINDNDKENKLIFNNYSIVFERVFTIYEELRHICARQ